MFCRFCGLNIPDNAKFCPHCGEVLKKEEESPIEAPTIDSSSNPDFKLYLEGEAETVFLTQYVPSKVYLIVEKLSSARIPGVKVQLSGPLQVNILIKSRRANSKINRFYFTISASKPGIFMLTATLTSKAGHRIAFPIKIQVEPKYANFSEKPPVKPIYQAPKSSSPEGGAIVALIVIGLTGGILLLVGILMLMGGGSSFTIGITLAVTGFLLLSCILGIASKGECCCVCCY